MNSSKLVTIVQAYIITVDINHYTATRSRRKRRNILRDETLIIPYKKGGNGKSPIDLSFPITVDFV